MNQEKLQENLIDITENLTQDTFIYDLLAAYDFPKSTITLLKKEPDKLSRISNQVILKNKLVFHKTEDGDDVHEVIDRIRNVERIQKFKPRFIIVTDFQTFLAIDTKTDETLDIKISNLPKYYAFFLPWAGMEKAQHANEKEADIRAAGTMAKLYDQIVTDNPEFIQDHLHDLNQFLTRLLFCFFAEDSNIFPENIFTDSVDSHTQSDGTDLQQYFKQLFDILNLEASNRNDLVAHLKDFPYVNGGLFAAQIEIPVFTKKSRDIIIDSGKLDWAVINPDIFGSMIQAVTNPGLREDLGMHYTSVPNILKVIQPLFMNELYEEFEAAGSNTKKLENLHKRITEIKIFDPACGSGNFLIIAYKELCKLESVIFSKIQESGGNGSAFSSISLDSFYGIEVDDFAHKVAKLSLWLAQHQINQSFSDMFGMLKPTLPLGESGNIEKGNATRLDWEKVCPIVEGSEVYVLGNPPYLGFLQQKKVQKEDMEVVLSEIGSYKKLDYISCWFWKAAKYIYNTDIEVAFVSTNSITQGEQTTLLWKPLFQMGIEIGFAYQSFKWQNLAKKNAGVTCVIVSIRNINNHPKYLYHSDGHVTKVENINAYLATTANIFVEKRSKPLSDFPKIELGGSAYDGGHLMLTKSEKESFITNNPEAKKYIARFMGSAEFIRDIERYCIWIDDSQAKEAYKVMDIKKRLDLVKSFRLSSERSKTFETAATPYKFTEYRYKDAPAIIAPIISSESRSYIPFGFIGKGIVVPNSARIIYNPEPFIFGVMTSRMHMVWVKAVAGRLKTDIRYSGTLCYNTFPFPEISTQQENLISENVFNILDEREKHPERTLSELYNLENMPLGLKKAHEFLDEVVDRIYQKKPFDSDEERLACLFKKYETMLVEESKK